MTDHYREKCVCGAVIDCEITPDTVDLVHIWAEKHRNCRQIITPAPPKRPDRPPYPPSKGWPQEPWRAPIQPYYVDYTPPNPVGPYCDAIPRADFEALRARIIENYAGPCI